MTETIESLTESLNALRQEFDELKAITMPVIKQHQVLTSELLITSIVPPKVKEEDDRAG